MRAIQSIVQSISKHIKLQVYRSLVDIRPFFIIRLLFFLLCDLSIIFIHYYHLIPNDLNQCLFLLWAVQEVCYQILWRPVILCPGKQASLCIFSFMVLARVDDFPIVPQFEKPNAAIASLWQNSDEQALKEQEENSDPHYSTLTSRPQDERACSTSCCDTSEIFGTFQVLHQGCKVWVRPTGFLS